MSARPIADDGIDAQAHARLNLDVTNLKNNWRALRDRAGVDTGAAVKADGYGLGAQFVVDMLADAGARDFFVAHWGEAAAIDLPDGCRLAVLHGVQEGDEPLASQLPARPVLNSPEQARRWRAIAPDEACDVMVDTGMNRLGFDLDELGALDGLRIDTLHSHLACADEPGHPLNRKQLERFRSVVGRVGATRTSLANSAGVFLGDDYAFDLVRPGIALYGGIPVEAARDVIMPVVGIEARLLQRRLVRQGDSVGYGATFVAERDMPVGVLNLGYADGYPRRLSGLGTASWNGTVLPMLGRVSMDLIAVDLSDARDAGEGDWIDVQFDLADTAAAAGLSQYELLTGLGSRFEAQYWTEYQKA